jgi:hypothetical protein
MVFVKKNPLMSPLAGDRAGYAEAMEDENLRKLLLFP